MINLEIRGKPVDDIDLIIFDKDGTLFELYPYWAVVATRRAENICRAIYRNKSVIDLDLAEQISVLMGVNNQKQRMEYNGAIGRLNRKEIKELIFFYLEGRGVPITSKIIEGAFAEADHYLAENNEALKQSLAPVRGIMDLLPVVASGSKCAIFSYDQTCNLERITRIMNIDKYFSTLVGGDLTRHPKPSPLDTIKIMRDLNTLPKNTMFVGDSINDMYSGRDAGCKCLVAIKSDISNLDLISQVADFVIDDYTGIKVRQ